MTSIPERQSIVSLIQQANQDGARLDKACAEAGICLRTYRRWYRDGAVQDDKRPTAVRPAPANKLTATEQGRIIELCNSPGSPESRPDCLAWAGWPKAALGGLGSGVFVLKLS